MSYYDNVYQKRLNRYGYDYQTRVQGQRERFFENLLIKSIYRIDFEYKDEFHPAIFEKYKQNETEVLHYLLTRIDTPIPAGTILWIQEDIRKDELHPWMVYWKEQIPASGYNRHIMLKMTHYVVWNNRDDVECASWAYFYGQEDNMLKDELKSRSRSSVLYNENLKTSFFITSTNEDIQKEDYFEMGEGKLKLGYRVTGFDFVSTPGVEYVTVDPVYLRDHTPIPEQAPEDDPDDFFWLKGGNE